MIFEGGVERKKEQNFLKEFKDFFYFQIERFKIS